VRRRTTHVDRRTWWAAFGIVLMGLLLWSVALPLLASPDEPSHVIKAAAVARGELMAPPGDGGSQAATQVTVPAGLNERARVPCFARTRQSAGCQHLRPADGHLESAKTLAGRYPPLYYALVGPGSWLAPGPWGMRLMRLLSAVVSSAFLASAFVSCLKWRSGLGPTGLVVAVTPTAVFLAGTVNPNGLELTAAVCLWTSGLALLDDPAVASSRLVARIGASAGTFVLVRGLSPLLLALTAAVLLLCSAPRALRPLLARRDVRTTVGLVFVASLLAVAFIRTAGTLSLAPLHAIQGLTMADAVARSFALTPFRFQQMIAYLGWLDTLPPPLTTYLWYFGLGLLLTLALATARTRHRWALAVAVAVTVALPLLEAPQAASLGFVWQGRYTLPFAVGVPLVAAWACRLPAAADGDPSFPRALERWTVGLLLVGHLLVFVWTLRRFAVGLDGSFTQLINPTWHPPLPPLLLVLAYGLTLTATGVLLARASRTSSVLRDRAATGV
jgi:hypothetical protein